MFLLLFIILFHEIGHVLGAKLFSFKINKIIIYPFGGLSIYDSLLNEKIYKEIIICLLGPFFQLILIIIFLIFKNYINEITFEKFILINKLLFMYNLLPIYPLDGGRLLNNFLELFLPFSLSKKITYLISYFMCFILIIVFIIKKEYLIVLLFFLSLNNLIKNIYLYREIYNKFLLERTLYDFNFPNGKIIDKCSDIMKNKKYKIKKNNYLYKECDYLKKFVFRV